MFIFFDNIETLTWRSKVLKKDSMEKWKEGRGQSQDTRA